MAKHDLNSKIWIRAIGLSFLRDQNVEKRREEENREEEEEEEKKKRREEQRKSKRYGKLKFSMDLWIFVWNLTFSMDYLDFLVWIHVLGCGL